MRNGGKTGNEHFSVFLSVNENGTRLFAANIAKKTFKKSVDRNRYKRWIRAVFHRHKNRVKNMDILIMPKPGIAKLKNFQEIEDSLLPLFPENKG
jgi:ribonuclease P protein component